MKLIVTAGYKKIAYDSGNSPWGDDNTSVGPNSPGSTHQLSEPGDEQSDEDIEKLWMNKTPSKEKAEDEEMPKTML